jgi:aminoglycoside 3-N-acetyltransferase
VEYQVLDLHADDFGALGEAFDAAHQITVHRIAQAEVRVFKQRALVDFAVAWMEQHRDLTS